MIFADSFACSSTSLCRHAVTAGGLRSTRSISSRGWAMLAQRSPWAIGLCVIGAILLWAVITLFVALFGLGQRSEEHTSELQSLMRNSYAVFCLKKKKNHIM